MSLGLLDNLADYYLGMRASFAMDLVFLFLPFVPPKNEQYNPIWSGAQAHINIASDSLRFQTKAYQYPRKEGFTQSSYSYPRLQPILLENTIT